MSQQPSMTDSSSSSTPTPPSTSSTTTPTSSTPRPSSSLVIPPGSRPDGSYRAFYAWEDRRGMTVTSGTVTLTKDAKNLVGISIGGGAPYCPCLYVVQIFDKTPAAIDGSLMSGDEITAVNGKCVKGKTRLQVAKMIQEIGGQVTINFNKLHADASQGKCIDIDLKKVKHRFVESMSSSTADVLGLSRAILCNDVLVKKLEDLEAKAETFRGLIAHIRRLLRSMLSIADVYRVFAAAFSDAGVHDPFPSASEALLAVGVAHRGLERLVVDAVRTLKPMIGDLGTFLNQAVPDIRMTIKKYADVKFEYLSYCLKVKEMDDEEYGAAVVDDPLYRVETGNYDYRVVLRCRQLARSRFAKSRSDVMVKLELLESKQVQDTVFQLQRFVEVLLKYYQDSLDVVRSLSDNFPVEIELGRVAGVADGRLDFADDFDEDVEEKEEEEEDDELLEEAGEVGEEERVGEEGGEESKGEEIEGLNSVEREVEKRREPEVDLLVDLG